ncbi:MAG: ABC transporter ATP-binding protein [Rhodoglobus sp.]
MADRHRLSDVDPVNAGAGTGAGVATRGDSPVLTAEDLYKFYWAGEEETRALRGVALTVHAGEIVAITGPSGSGKSTLLSCLAGLEEPSGGTVQVAGQRISRQNEQVRSRLRAELIGMLWQAGNLIEHLDVTENVLLARALARKAIPRKHAGNARETTDVEHLLAAVGLTARAHSLPAQLSGGEAARAGLAVALANNPPLLLADEPTGELDSTTEASILALLKDLAAQGTAVVVVTHSPLVARTAHRQIHLQDGRVAA